MIVGITGGIGSGKSTVCRIFEELGASVYDSDSHAKSLMENDADLRRELAAAFGEKVYVDGRLDRKYLASAVFADDSKLKILNSLVHPVVRTDFHRWCREQSAEILILESAILFESGFDGEVDSTLAVVAPAELRIERVRKRSGATREEVERRIAAQMSDDELCERTDRMIVNISLDALRSDVEQLYKILRYEALRDKIRP